MPTTLLFEYATLFSWSFAAATVLPLSSELPFAYLVHDQRTLWAPVAVATAGNFIGACTTYWLARAARRALGARATEQKSDTECRRRARAIVARWGGPALLLSWIPVVGDALVAAAGAARTPFLSAAVFLATGKLLRYLTVGWAALSVSSR